MIAPVSQASDNRLENEVGLCHSRNFDLFEGISSEELSTYCRISIRLEKLEDLASSYATRASRMSLNEILNVTSRLVPQWLADLDRWNLLIVELRTQNRQRIDSQGALSESQGVYRFDQYLTNLTMRMSLCVRAIQLAEARFESRRNALALEELSRDLGEDVEASRGRR
jgi:hypothetical protein